MVEIRDNGKRYRHCDECLNEMPINPIPPDDLCFRCRGHMTWDEYYKYHEDNRSD